MSSHRALGSSARWRRPVRRATTLVGLVVMAALASLQIASSASAEALVQTEVLKAPISFTIADTCTGEDIAVVGELHFLAHVTSTPNGKLFTIDQAAFEGVTGTGLTSGLTYRALGASMQRSNLSGGPFPNDHTYIVREQFILPGAGNNFAFFFTAHLTIDANGVAHAAFDNLKSECR